MATPLTLPPRKARESIFNYRLRIVKEMGFNKKDAFDLAGERDLNLVDIAILIDKGCPLELVPRILL